MRNSDGEQNPWPVPNPPSGGRPGERAHREEAGDSADKSVVSCIIYFAMAVFIIGFVLLILTWGFLGLLSAYGVI